MSMFDLTLPNLVGYGIVLAMFVVALVHRFMALALIQRRSEPCDEYERLELEITSPTSLPSDESLDRVKQTGNHLKQRGTLPAHGELMLRAAQEPRLASNDQAVSCWITDIMQAAYGKLEQSVAWIERVAPCVGLAFTILGIQLGVYLFREAKDQIALLANIAFSLMTTFGCIGVAVLEGWTLDRLLVPLREREENRCMLTAARLDEWLGRGSSHDAQELKEQVERQTQLLRLIARQAQNAKTTKSSQETPAAHSPAPGHKTTTRNLPSAGNRSPAHSFQKENSH